jgi:hypothetical protein
MLAKQKKKKREEQNTENKDTKIKDPKKIRSSDEHNKTSKNKTNSGRSKEVVIVEERQDLLDFDCDADLEDFGVKKRRKVYLNKSLKKVLPESLIYSLNNWKANVKPQGIETSDQTSDVTRARINSGRKYINLHDDSQFFLRDFFANDWDRQSEILDVDTTGRRTDFKTLPFDFPKKTDDTKSETLMDLNAILSKQNEGMSNESQSRLESFLIPHKEGVNAGGRLNEGIRELMKREGVSEDKEETPLGKMKKKRSKVVWEEVGESPKKDFKIEDSFYRHLKREDIEKILNRKSKTSQQKQRIGKALLEKIKNKKILDQLKNCSNKIVNGKNLFKRKYNSSIKKSKREKKSRSKDTEGKKAILRSIKVQNTKVLRQKEIEKIYETCQPKKEIEGPKSNS